MNSSYVLLTQTYARPEAIEAGQAVYAANVTGLFLSFFQEYSGIDYNLRKLGKTVIIIIIMEWWCKTFVGCFCFF